MTDTENELKPCLAHLSHDPDAAKWAAAFKDTFPDEPLAQDEGLMIGWFANAMMAMHDHLMQKHEWNYRPPQAGDALTFAGFRDANVQRCVNGFNHALESWTCSDWFTATMGELGEAANVAKKLNRIRDGLAGANAAHEIEEYLRNELAKEIADTFIYLDLLAASEGIDLAEAVPAKFNATSEKLGLPHRIDAHLSKPVTGNAALVEQIASFIEQWNGSTRDGDTFLIASEIRETFVSQPAGIEQDALVEIIRTAIATAKARWTAGDQYEQSLVSQHYDMPSVKHMAEHVAAALKDKKS